MIRLHHVPLPQFFGQSLEPIATPCCEHQVINRIPRWINANKNLILDEYYSKQGLSLVSLRVPRRQFTVMQ